MTYSAQGLDNHEILVALSTKINEAILHLHFDNVDQKNHKSLNQLVHILEESGYEDIAQIVKDEKPYLFIDQPLMASKVNEFINAHSAAVYSSLTYKGLKNQEAVELIQKEYPKEKESHNTGVHYFKIKF